jgi:hypothetical protein
MTTYRTEIRASGGFHTINLTFEDNGRATLEYHSASMGIDPKYFFGECSYENLSPYHGWLRLLSVRDGENRMLYSWAEDEFRGEGGVGIIFEYFRFPEPQRHFINDVVMEEMRAMASVSHNPMFSLLVLGFDSYDATNEKYRELLDALETSKFAKVDN